MPRFLLFSPFVAAMGLCCAAPQASAQAKAAILDSLGDPLPRRRAAAPGNLRFRPPSSVVELALSPDEKTIVTVGRELIAWDAATRQRTVAGQSA